MAGSDGESEAVMGKMDTGEDGDEYGLSRSAPDGSVPDRNSRCSPLPTAPGAPSHIPALQATRSCAVARLCRLARKAESARQARLRHKQFVTDLQGQVDAAQERVRQLESFCTQGPGSAAVAVRELRSALAPDQLLQLQQWCAAALRARAGRVCVAPRSARRGPFCHSLLPTRKRCVCAQAHGGAGREPRAEEI